MDPTLADGSTRNEVIRIIHIGLLCVQDNPEDRPTMSSVVLMLSSYKLTLASPSQPAFFAGSITRSNQLNREGESSEQSKNSSISLSANELSIIKTNPR